MYVKGVVAGLLLAALIAAPAYALENNTEAGAGTTASEEAVGESATCPNCGRDVVIGRHGQAGLTTVCPYCGKEICTAEEAERQLCFGADFGLFSKYVSRGVTLSEDPVFQPDVWASYRGFTMSVWGNMDLSDVNENEGELNELDFTLDYSGQWESITYSAGGIYYVFPNTGANDTAELYAALGYDVILQPTLTVFYDFVDADGFYLVLGIGHAFDIPLPTKALCASLELGAQAGWGSANFNEFNAGVHKDAFTDYVLTASMPVGVGDNLTITPMLSYSSALDDDIRAANEHNDNVVWGTTLSVSF